MSEVKLHQGSVLFFDESRAPRTSENTPYASVPD